MFIPSIERFARMVEENGHVVLDRSGIWQMAVPCDLLIA